MEDEILDEQIKCQQCDCDVEREDDLLPYEGINVCNRCYDELNLIDEQHVHEWETEGYDEY